MANGNGNGNFWMWMVRIFMFSLPFLIGLMGYYVKTENSKAIHESEARTRTTYISNNDFQKWVDWQYRPQQKQVTESLVRIERALEKHSEGDD